MDRIELADFLRRSRTRLTPSDVGLSAGPRRRTPGLRREEVAQLAGMSTDYYTRLEQRRGSHPSRQMLTALARALRLTDVERDHLFHLAGEEPPRPGGSCGHVRPGLLMILDRLTDLPASVLSDWGEVLAQNTMSVALTGDHMGTNVIRRWFTSPGARALFPPENHEQHARSHVASLRAVTAARPTIRDRPRSSMNSAPLQGSSRRTGSRTMSSCAARRRSVSSTAGRHPRSRLRGTAQRRAQPAARRAFGAARHGHPSAPRTAAGRRPPGPRLQLIVDAAPGHGARPLGASIPPPAGDRRAGCGPTRCAGRVPDGRLRAPGRGVGGTGALAGQAMRPVRGAVGVREVRCTTPTLGGGHRPANWPPFFIARELATTAARLRERDDPFPRTRCGRWRSTTAKPPFSSVCCSATISGREG